MYLREQRRAYNGNDGYEHGGVLTVLVFVPVEPMSKEYRDAETRVGLPPLLLAGNAPDRLHVRCVLTLARRVVSDDARRVVCVAVPSKSSKPQHETFSVS